MNKMYTSKLLISLLAFAYVGISLAADQAPPAQVNPAQQPSAQSMPAQPSVAKLNTKETVSSLPESAGGDIDKMDRYNMETLLLDAQLKNLDTKARIAQKLADIEKIKSGASASGPSQQAQPQQRSFQGAQDSLTVGYGMPTYKSIEGVTGSLFAVISFPGGSEIEASEGDVLPNGMKVLKIAPGRVEVLSGKSKVRLAAQSGASTSQANSFQNQLPVSTGAFIPPSM